MTKNKVMLIIYQLINELKVSERREDATAVLMGIKHCKLIIWTKLTTPLHNHCHSVIYRAFLRLSKLEIQWSKRI